MSYGSWLVVTCLGIAPCYAISELLFGIPECFTMSGYCTMLCNSWIDRLFRNQPDVTWPDVTWPDMVSSRDPPDLKKIIALTHYAFFASEASTVSTLWHDIIWSCSLLLVYCVLYRFVIVFPSTLIKPTFLGLGHFDIDGEGIPSYIHKSQLCRSNFTKLKSDRKLHIIRIWTPYSDLKIKIKCACAYMSSITH